MSNAKANEPDRVNTGALSVMIALVAFTTLAVALVVTSLVRQESRDLRAERDSTQDQPLRSLQAEQLSKLTASPSWADRAKGYVTLPLEKAMSLTLRAVQKNPYALTPGLQAEGLGGAGPEETEADQAQDAAPTEQKPAGDSPSSDGNSAAPSGPSALDQAQGVEPANSANPAPSTPSNTE